jgi:anti-sigma factor RsiW
MANSEHTLRERIQLLIDGRLDDTDRRALEQALANDPEGRQLLESMRWIKQSTRSALGEATDAAITGRIRAALDREDAGPAGAAAPSQTGGAGSRRWWLAAAAVLALVAVLAVFYTTRTGPRPTFPRAAAADLLAYEEDRLPLVMQTEDVQALEAFFVEQGIQFPTRVFDLVMMDFHLVGGVVHELRGNPAAAFVYRGPGGIYVLCQMYQGRIEDLPETDDIRENEGIKFYSYRVDGVAVTFWREGDVICVLASRADPEQVVALAFAKAVKI